MGGPRGPVKRTGYGFGFESLTRSGATTTYRYDDVGQRIAKQVGTGNTEVHLREGATTLGVASMTLPRTKAIRRAFCQDASDNAFQRGLHRP